MEILPPPTSSKVQSASNATQLANLFDSIHELVTKIGQVVEVVSHAVSREWAKAERQHHRGQLRRAYKVRRSWKKSDQTSLASLDVNETAQRKIMNLTGTGRPVVQPYEALGERLRRKIIAVHVLFNEDGTPEDRRKPCGNGLGMSTTSRPFIGESMPVLNPRVVAELRDTRKKRLRRPYAYRHQRSIKYAVEFVAVRQVRNAFLRRPLLNLTLGCVPVKERIWRRLRNFVYVWA